MGGLGVMEMELIRGLEDGGLGAVVHIWYGLVINKAIL